MVIPLTGETANIVFSLMKILDYLVQKQRQFMVALQIVRNQIAIGIVVWE